MLINYEARNQREVFHLRSSLPRARCLTLALAPNGAGPGRHLRFTDVTLGGPLATRARVGRLTTLERPHAIHPFRLLERSGARGSGIKQPRRFAARFGTRASRPHAIQPGLTERTLALLLPRAVAPLVAHRLDSRQVSALFGPRTMTDSPALQTASLTPRPLTNEASSRCVRSDGRKLARQSGTTRARPKKPKRSRGFARP